MSYFIFLRNSNENKKLLFDKKKFSVFYKQNLSKVLVAKQTSLEIIVEMQIAK